MASPTSKPPSKPVQALKKTDFSSIFSKNWLTDETFHSRIFDKYPANHFAIIDFYSPYVKTVFSYPAYSPNCSAHSFIILRIGR